MEIESLSFLNQTLINNQSDSQFFDNDNSQVKTCENNSDNSNSVIDICNNEGNSLEVVKKKRKHKMREAGVQTLYDTFKFRDNNTYHVFGDLCISNNFQIKLGGCTAWSNLGFDCLSGEQVVRYDNFVDLQLRFNNIQKIPMDVVISELSNVSHHTYQQFSQALIQYNTFIKSIQDNSQILNYLQTEDYEKEYQQYSQYCLDKVKELSKKHHLYSYCIGKTNFSNGQLDVSHIGYSNGFLELICLDYEMIQQMVLRDRQFQLITDIEQMLEQSLICLVNRIQDNQSFSTKMKITTLDGYELWINQIYHKIKIPQFQGKGLLYFFCFCELDIDLDQLKGLLEYRQQIYVNKLNYENFLKKELSFYSDDVEYSIISQSFIEKFYKSTYDQLMNQKKIEENQEVIHPLKICGYRNVN